MAKLEIDMDEARRIARQAVAYVSLGAHDTFDAQPVTVQIQATAGVVNIVRALQDLGYRIAPPLKTAGEE